MIWHLVAAALGFLAGRMSDGEKPEKPRKKPADETPETPADETPETPAAKKKPAKKKPAKKGKKK